jgi:predicted restriction endonuclease
VPFELSASRLVRRAIRCDNAHMESDHAKQTRTGLEVALAAPWLDVYDREIIRNLFAEEPSFDYLSALTNRRIEKILKESEFRKRHPNAAGMG